MDKWFSVCENIFRNKSGTFRNFIWYEKTTQFGFMRIRQSHRNREPRPWAKADPARAGCDSGLSEPRTPIACLGISRDRAHCRALGCLAGLGVTRLWPSHGCPVPVSATAETRAQFQASGCLAEGQGRPWPDWA